MLGGRQHARRLGRWALRQQEFDFQVKHKPGQANTNADALSRVPSNESTEVSSPVVMTMSERVVLPSTSEQLMSQEEDPVHGQLIQF